MLKDILTDIVTHTQNLNFPFARIVGTEEETVIMGLSEKNKVAFKATLHNPLEDFQGVFGFTNLNILNLLLKNPEYKENPKIEIHRNKHNVPNGIYFENEDKDFNNTYKLMVTETINEKLKSFEVATPKWDIEFTPSVNSVQRLKLQSQVYSDENLFRSKVEKNNLILNFGGFTSNHEGNFIFQSNVEGKMKNTLIWPLPEVITILSFDGDMLMQLSDEGQMRIIVDSGLAVYEYSIFSNSK
jgi:hypothetical protein